MSAASFDERELIELLEQGFEDRLSDDDRVRLETILRAEPAARRLYRSYLTLHGLLYWDTAFGSDSTFELPAYVPTAIPAPPATSAPLSARHAERRMPRYVLAGTLTAVAAVLSIVLWPGTTPNPETLPITQNDPGTTPDPAVPPGDRDPRPQHTGPLALSPTTPTRDRDAIPTIPELTPSPNVAVTQGSSDAVIREYIEAQIRAGWEASEIEPSAAADDAEWLRRVHLDLIGRIPTASEATAFLDDRSPDKRERVVDRLLERPEYVYHWSTVWTNLLVGRAPEREEFQVGVAKFLRDSFRENRPWNEIVGELVSAEGTPEENGASGFLLAHVNNQAVPATAVTAKVFLGTQVSCTQCHDHPFNDAKQNQFWELNTFFKQTEVVDEGKYDPETGRRLREVALRKKSDAGGPTFYESRNGLVRPAYPIFAGEIVPEGPEVDRRKELARLLAVGEKPQIAEAFVNRLWKHFFGYGFTNPVDDMGPHNPATHPQLLDRLAREFVLSGYDQKRLMKWICLSEPYQLTSRPGAGNVADSPELGDFPLFSRVYVKPMSAEQAFDSLLVATGAASAQAGNWDQIERQRRKWLQQFVQSYGTDDNDESTSFSGTVPQALMLMNGELIQEALRYDRPTQFQSIVRRNVSDTEKIRQLCLSALSRYPSDEELSAMKRLLTRATAGAGNGQRQELTVQGLQDIFWAYLNSSEFAVVH